MRGEEHCSCERNDWKGYKIIMKRLFDILFSVVALLMLAPLFLIVAILIKMESRGPVLFRQKRIGRGFIPFTLYTFRITAGNLSQQDLATAAGGDVGSTRVGGFLRKTRLSGLPQIWNVFKGDMSIVGPHPELEKYVYKYVDDYNVILNVRPGIIGVASSSSDEESILSGREDPEDYYIHVLLPDKIKLAKGYVKRASLHYDLELMVLTLINLLYPYKTFIRTVEALLPYRRLIVVVAELTICVISIFLAFYIRFDGAIPPPPPGTPLEISSPPDPHPWRIPLCLLTRQGAMAIREC